MCKEMAPTAPDCAMLGAGDRYFQYRDGVVPEWSRFTHLRCGVAGSQVQSWCRQVFWSDEVEECSAPGTSVAGLPGAVAECTDCLVCFAFRGSAGKMSSAEPENIPARIDTPGQMAAAMRFLQQELMDEAGRIPRGEVDLARLGRLAAETERFSRGLRRFQWLAARGS